MLRRNIEYNFFNWFCTWNLLFNGLFQHRWWKNSLKLDAWLYIVVGVKWIFDYLEKQTRVLVGYLDCKTICHWRYHDWSWEYSFHQENKEWNSMNYSWICLSLFKILRFLSNKHWGSFWQTSEIGTIFN